ncbi:hypothetical protein V6N13_059829 [Hibiscus sabdariffa]
MSLPLALSANPKLPKKQRRRDEDPPDPLFPPMGSFRPRWNMMFRRLEGIWSLTRTLSLDLATDGMQDSISKSLDYIPIPALSTAVQPALQDVPSASDSAPPTAHVHMEKNNPTNKTTASTKRTSPLSLLCLRKQLFLASSTSKSTHTARHPAFKSVMPLDPLKHQAVHVQDGDHPRLTIEIVTGCGHCNFVHVTHQYLRDYSPNVVCFVETRISKSNADRVIASLNFSSSFRVEAIGFLVAFGFAARIPISTMQFLTPDFTTLATRDLTSFGAVLIVRFVSIGWLQHADFNHFVKNKWDSSTPISATIEKLCAAAASWNRYVFGSIPLRKRHVIARLRGVQRSLGHKHNTFLSQLENSLLIELEQILDQEELLWK